MLLAVPGISYVLLRNSAVQTFLVKRVAVVLSNQLETRVEVGGLDVSFFLNIVLEDVLVEDQAGEPLIQTKRMVFDIGKVSFRHRHLTINKLFLEDAFVGSRKYAGEDSYNFTFLTNYFANSKSESRSASKWDVVVKSLDFSDSSFGYANFNIAPTGPGFDSNHISISKLRLAMQDIFWEDDNISFTLDILSFRASENYALQHLSGIFAISSSGLTAKDVVVKSALSELQFGVDIAYNGYNQLKEDPAAIVVQLDVDGSAIDLSDVGYFFPELYGIEGLVSLQGRAEGTLAQLNTEQIILSYGSQTGFRGHGSVSNLHNPDSVFFDLIVDEAHTSMMDVASFRLPLQTGRQFPVLPDYAYKLGNISFQGRFAGNNTQLMAEGTFISAPGRVFTRLNLTNIQGSLAYMYDGIIKTDGFDLGRLFGEDNKLGVAALDLSLNGRGNSFENIDVRLDGMVQSIIYAGYDYQNIDVAGTIKNKTFNGFLQITDPNLFFSFLGEVSFTDTMPVYDFQASLKRANLTELNLYQRDSQAASVLSFDVNINGSGSSIDDAIGQVDICDILYEDVFAQADTSLTKAYRTGNISLINMNFPERGQSLSLLSDFAEINLNGKIIYSQLFGEFKKFAATFIPAFAGINQPASTTPPAGNSHGNGQGHDLTMSVQFRSTDMLTELFAPFISISEDAGILLNFNSERKVLDIEGQADTLSLFGNNLVDWNMLGSIVAAGYQFTTQSSFLKLSDSLIVDNFCFDALFYNDTMLFETNWKSFDPGANSHGNIVGLTRFLGNKRSTTSFLPSYAMLKGAEWNINAANEVVVDSSRIAVRNLVFYHGDQHVKADGVLSSLQGDRLEFYFNEFDYANIDFLLRISNMDFGGIMNGKLSLAAIFQPVRFEAALQFRDFLFNYVRVGDLYINSSWDESAKGLRLDGELRENTQNGYAIPLIVSGYFYPEREQDNFNLRFASNRLPLAIWRRYLDSVVQDIQGYAVGDIFLKGPASSPYIEGNPTAVDASFRVDYLNTKYTFSHEIQLGRDFFRFENLMLADTLGNTGLAAGTVWHRDFREFSMDIMIRPERMIMLNTTASQNEYYFGKAFGTGLLHIHGTEDNITMDISARTSRGTQVSLPLISEGQVAESDFIRFVSHATAPGNESFSQGFSTGINLNFDLEVSPDAEIQLIFDSQIGDVIRGRGNANLKLEITSQGAFNMYGEYIIQEGEYLFTLQNLINKRFRIEEGGTIRWTGDINDADVDLRAAYRLRTSLYDLMMDIDTSDVYRRRVPVDCVLILKDKLFNPAISFDIAVPGGDEGLREMIERRITTEQEMNRQIFSLLVLNRFMPTTTDQYNTALGYGFGSTSTELLSNQLSNWLSQISNDFDIGINYRPGDQISSQELEVALSTQLFDDRVSIDGNLGVAGSNPAFNQQTSNIIGDVNIEVKLTPEGKFRIKAFNRSNTFDIINTNSPYTQGVGIFYRKEFDNLSEFFKRQRRPGGMPLFDED